jgi:hypothetical protein
MSFYEMDADDKFYNHMTDSEFKDWYDSLDKIQQGIVDEHLYKTRYSIKSEMLEPSGFLFSYNVRTAKTLYEATLEIERLRAKLQELEQWMLKNK